MKRSAAPALWRIPRKIDQFTVAPKPGPHSVDESYPLAVLCREVLKLVRSYREAKRVIKQGSLIVDGVVRREIGFPVGLMDVVEIPVLGKVYRLLPHGKMFLQPFEIPVEEKGVKLCKIVNKTSLKGGIIQYGLHDGRTLRGVEGDALKCGDVCLIEVPSQKLVDSVKLEKGALGLIVKGDLAGLIGEVRDIKPGTISRSSTVAIALKDKVRELPTDFLMIVGKGRPLLTIPVFK